MDNDILKYIDTLIDTGKSFFKIYKFKDNDLLEKCIKESDFKLHDSRFRSVRFFSNEVKGIYKYGKVEVSTAVKLTPSLEILLNRMNDIFDSDYNGIIINKYENGNQFIEKHSDSKNHPDNGVMLISYGITRNFRVFDKKTGNKIMDIPLIHGEMIHMGGDFQAEFEHDVEKQPKITGSRHSISFHKYMNLGLY